MKLQKLNRNNRLKPLKIPVFLLAFIFVTVIFFTLPPGENILKKGLEKQLRKQTRLIISIGKLHTNLISKTALEELSIHESDEAGKEYLYVKKAAFRYSLLSWIKEEPILKAIELEGFSVQIRQDSSGVTLLPIPVLTGKRSKPSSRQWPPVNINNVFITASRLEYNNLSIPLDLVLDHFTFQLSREENKLNFALESDSVYAGIRNIPLNGQNLSVKGNLDPVICTLDTFGIRLYDQNLTGKGTLFYREADPSLSGQFRLQGELSRIPAGLADLLPVDIISWKGTNDIDLILKGTLNNPILTAKLSLAKVEINRFYSEKTEGMLQWESDSLAIKSLNMKSLGGNIHARGVLAFGTPSSGHIFLQCDSLQIDPLWSFLYGTDSPYKGKIRIRMNAGGVLQDPESWTMSSDINLRKTFFRSKAVPDLSVRLNMKKGSADIQIDQEGTRIYIETSIQKETINGLITYDINDLEPLAGFFQIHDLNGAVRGSGTLSGSFPDPVIVADITGQNIKYRNFPLDTLQARFRIQNQQIFMDTCRITGNVAEIDTAHPPFYLTDFQGGFEYRCQLQGPLKTPDGFADIHLMDTAYRDVELDSGQINLTLRDHNLGLDSLWLEKDSLQITGSGSYSLNSHQGSILLSLQKTEPEDRPGPVKTGINHKSLPGSVAMNWDQEDQKEWNCTIQTKDLSLQYLYKWIPNPIPYAGRLSMNAEIAIKQTDISGRCRLKIIQPEIQNSQADSLLATIILQKLTLSLDPLELFHKDRKARFSSHIELSPGQMIGFPDLKQCRLTGSAHWDQMELRFLAPLFVSIPDMRGQSSAGLSWNGTLSHLQLTGFLTIREGFVRLRPDAVPLEKCRADFNFKKTETRININATIQSVPVEVEGNITWPDWQTLTFDSRMIANDNQVAYGSGYLNQDSILIQLASNGFNLAVLKPLLPDIQKINGILQSNIDIAGSPDNPVLNGSIQIQDIELQTKIVYPPVTGGLFNATLQNQTIRIDTLSLNQKEGYVTLQGTVNRSAGMNHWNLESRIHNLKFSQAKQYDINIRTGQLILTSQNTHSDLKGQISLGKTIVTASVQTQDLIAFSKSYQWPKKTPSEFLKQTRLNVRIEDSKEIWINNNLARLRLHSELRFSGTMAQPNITGRLSAEEGYIYYLDRKFNTEKGVLDFIDPQKINPWIDLLATTDIKTYQTSGMPPYRISLSIQGNLNQPRFDLNSNPALDHSDIIALLTLGTTREQLAVSVSGTGNTLSGVLQQRAEQLSSRQIASFASRKVGNILDLDEITIEGNLFQFGRNWGPELVASKKLSPRMEITYSTNAGHTNDQSIRLDYKLSDFFSLEGKTDQKGRSGIDLKFQLKYK